MFFETFTYQLNSKLSICNMEDISELKCCLSIILKHSISVIFQFTIISKETYACAKTESSTFLTINEFKTEGQQS